VSDEKIVQQREKAYYDQFWERTELKIVNGTISIPDVENLKGKKVLVCSCGKGEFPVMAAKQGAKVYAFDISETAVEKSREMAKFNKVDVTVDVMDFYNLSYQDNFFDIIFGSAILHHVDCAVVGQQLFRVLKPGGVAYFRENSDRNPLLRFLRNVLFGRPGKVARSKFLFFRRKGTADEYPLTDDEIRDIARPFDGQVRIYNESFYFFSLLNDLVFKSPKAGAICRWVDNVTVALIPLVRRYSFAQEVWLRKMPHEVPGDVSD